MYGKELPTFLRYDMDRTENERSTIPLLLGVYLALSRLPGSTVSENILLIYGWSLSKKIYFLKPRNKHIQFPKSCLKKLKTVDGIENNSNSHCNILEQAECQSLCYFVQRKLES
jgi:hypothetical protein